MLNLNLALLVEDYYEMPGNSAGGNLHIVLDDGNMEKGHLDYCASQCRAASPVDSYGLSILSILGVYKYAERLALYGSQYTSTEARFIAEENFVAFEEKPL